jgi:tetratricopeptide (TPR) repeat protein
VRGVFNDVIKLIDQIKDDQKDLEKVEEPLPFEVFTLNSHPGESTTGLNDRFVFFQILIDCLLRLKYTQDDKVELVKCLQKEYEGNRKELHHVDEFHDQYDPKQAVSWYTRDIFFYKAVNAALRKQNIHMIFLLRQYIADIHEQLTEVQSKERVTVYRCQMMDSNELKMLQQNVGQLISINSFFSASRNRSAALGFIKPSRATASLESVMFEIKAKPTNDRSKPFADISKYSYFPGEAEVLFMIGSIFRLERIDHEHNVWIIRVTLSDDGENILRPVLTHLKQEYGIQDNNLYSLGKILSRMKRYEEAERYLLRLLQEPPAKDAALASVYKELGTVAFFQGQSDRSMDWHQKAYKLSNTEENSRTSSKDSPSKKEKDCQ